MGLLDRLRQRVTLPDDPAAPMPGFVVVPGEPTRFVADPEVLVLMQEGRAQRSAQEQYIVLDMLADEGRALPMPDGFEVSADDVARLDADEAQILALPARFTGALETRVQKWTTSPDFAVQVTARVEKYPEPHERRGPLLVVGQTHYRLSPPQLRAMRAIEAHSALPAGHRTETANVRLVAELQAALRLATHADDPRLRDESFRLDLGALSRFTTTVPRTVGVTVTPQPDGSLDVEPDLGPGVDRDLLRSRWRQLDRYRRAAVEHAGGVLRVDDTIVLLEEQQLAGVEEVRRRPRIPAEQVSLFLEAPGTFLNPELVDVDVRFGVRVAGLGVVAPVSFAEASSSGIEWFTRATTLEGPHALADSAGTVAEHDEVESKVRETWDRGEEVVTLEGPVIVDVKDRSLVDEYLEAGRRRVEALEREAGVEPEPVPNEEQTPNGERSGATVTVGMHIRDADNRANRLRAAADAARPASAIDWSRLRRTPFAHQSEGIEWMTGLMQAALVTEEHDATRIQGALLADDMGLGKTFMTLAALGEAVESQRCRGHRPLPTLAVMPVALLENWLAEIEETFGSRTGPFEDVVVLHGVGLDHYRVSGRGTETAAEVDDLDQHGMVRAERLADLVSLKVGEEWGERRLDRAGILVLTTYETLRRYQVSLGLVHWGVVVMDEAQNTKNPEILVTRAAKGLQARFKLLATGTPVENSLQDFWCLVDTAQPGLLGSWAEFREEWATPMSRAEGDEHARLGRALRDAVGAFMLRRVKEDHLPELPSKSLHRYPERMPPVQVQAYDDVLTGHRAIKGTKGAALMTLARLRDVSLHPGLHTGHLRGDIVEIDHSARTFVTVKKVLDDVRSRDEKAIVFAQRKDLQRALRLWLSNRYGLAVDVVNGDTAATGGGSSRLARIRRFEAHDGFNVIVMSPLAVGVGLTVVGANHAIHLERHWNPAKEAQATDRIYRIGQTRPVHVHYPMAIHPDVDSFDVNLDRLLASKIALKDAVIVPQEVTQSELERSLGLT